ncbi:DUF397 domain-containing protein [Saccharopolyspora mangrovi]|uniref:DUF397 domain-containing protein n=1 Tax=Saccharopolyspora mangrovi TaxID=3082379 RepID=A0ABU6A942_9PSEU|nr:DUF397 domain-containing protein [Saccharopolyspora sp. S2-29]MEB3368092.1 DUF397 domain-containing protein [Saccharopolyspora sp. S2-29]
MNSVRLADATWRKSSRSANNAYCVEVAVTDEVVGVRDTKDRESSTLAFSRVRWNDFLSGLRHQHHHP